MSSLADDSSKSPSEFELQPLTSKDELSSSKKFHHALDTLATGEISLTRVTFTNSTTAPQSKFLKGIIFFGIALKLINIWWIKSVLSHTEKIMYRIISIQFSTNMKMYNHRI